jgi:hypothetical protein
MTVPIDQYRNDAAPGLGPVGGAIAADWRRGATKKMAGLSPGHFVRSGQAESIFP